MLYSDLGFWLAQQPVEVQIIAMYLMGLTTMALLVLDCWYDDWSAKRAKKRRIKEFEKLFNSENYHII